MHELLTEGLLRLWQVIGREELTEAQARANTEHNEQARKRAIAEGKLDAQGKPVFKRRPTRARAAVPAIIPVSKSTWWAGVRSGRFPRPVRIGRGRTTLWRAAEVVALTSQADE